MEDVYVKLGDLEIELLDSECYEFIDDNNKYIYYYLCVGLYNSNKILFHCINTNQGIVDFAQTIIDRLPKMALNYLIDVLGSNQNIMAHMTCYPDELTGFDIYYNCKCESTNVMDILDYELANNDFGAYGCIYTEITDGKQTAVKGTDNKTN